MACLPCAMARMATNGELAGSEAARVWWSKYGAMLLVGMAAVATTVVLAKLRRTDDSVSRFVRDERGKRSR
jgi:hypothetical protein